MNSSSEFFQAHYRGTLFKNRNISDISSRLFAFYTLKHIFVDWTLKKQHHLSCKQSEFVVEKLKVKRSPQNKIYCTVNVIKKCWIFVFFFAQAIFEPLVKIITFFLGG